MQNSSLKKSCIKPGTFSGPKWFKKGSGFLILRYFFVQIVQAKDRHLINSGTGSSCKQRKTGSSRWGTPCCTYRYRIWIFQGAFYSGAHPVFFTMLHRFPHEASGIRHQHGSGSDAAHPGIVPVFCAGLPYKHAGRQCHFPACFPIFAV